MVWTREAYDAIPESQTCFELEEGILIEMPQGSARHQEIITMIASVIAMFVLGKKLGKVWSEITVYLPGQTYYVPDISFVAAENLDKVNESGIEGAPDLVVEVLSPATRGRDQSTKLLTYQEAGVPYTWIVDPDGLVIQEFGNSAEGYILTQAVSAGETFSPKIFPELSFNLAELIGESKDETSNE